MVLGWLIRVLIAVLVLRAIWKFASRLFEGAPTPAPSRAQTRNVALVRDPVCRTYLTPSRALTTRDGGKVHYFCSEECRRAFDRNVERTPNEVS